MTQIFHQNKPWQKVPAVVQCTNGGRMYQGDSGAVALHGMRLDVDAEAAKRRICNGAEAVPEPEMPEVGYGWGV